MRFLVIIFVGIFSGCWSLEEIFIGCFVMCGLVICIDLVFICIFVCVVENVCVDFGCCFLFDVFEVIIVCVWMVIVFEVESELILNIFVFGEVGFLGFLDGENLELVDWLLFNVIGEGKVDLCGEVVGGDDDGGCGSLGDCLKDVKFKLSLELGFMCVVELFWIDGCFFGMMLIFCIGCMVFILLVDFLVVFILKSVL